MAALKADAAPRKKSVIDYAITDKSVFTTDEETQECVNFILKCY